MSFLTALFFSLLALSERLWETGVRGTARLRIRSDKFSEIPLRI